MNGSAPDPDEVREAIDFLAPLADPEFARAYAGCVVAPERDYDDVLRGSPTAISKASADAAFRSPGMIERTLVACNFHINRTANLVNPRSPQYDPGKAPGRQRFLEAMRRDRAMLGTYRKLAGGLPDNSPDPERRALHRLKQLNLKGPVPRGTYNRLLAEEKQKIKDSREVAREQRRAAEKAAARAPRRR